MSFNITAIVDKALHSFVPRNDRKVETQEQNDFSSSLVHTVTQTRDLDMPLDAEGSHISLTTEDRVSYNEDKTFIAANCKIRTCSSYAHNSITANVIVCGLGLGIFDEEFIEITRDSELGRKLEERSGFWTRFDAAEQGSVRAGLFASVPAGIVEKQLRKFKYDIHSCVIRVYRSGNIDIMTVSEADVEFDLTA